MLLKPRTALKGNNSHPFASLRVAPNLEAFVGIFCQIFLGVCKTNSVLTTLLYSSNQFGVVYINFGMKSR